MKTRRGLPINKVALLCVLVVIALGLLNAGPVVADSRVITVSGYEAFPGLPCSIADADSWCGVRFYGWFGGAGAVPEGWVSYTGQGRVVVRVNYSGQPGFGNSVTITGGTWRLVDQGLLASGAITGGTVTWPMPDADNGCGDGVATVEAALADGEFSRFLGCLQDFEADGQVAVPPKIWGSFE